MSISSWIWLVCQLLQPRRRHLFVPFHNKMVFQSKSFLIAFLWLITFITALLDVLEAFGLGLPLDADRLLRLFVRLIRLGPFHTDLAFCSHLFNTDVTAFAGIIAPIVSIGATLPTATAIGTLLRCDSVISAVDALEIGNVLTLGCLVWNHDTDAFVLSPLILQTTVVGGNPATPIFHAFLFVTSLGVIATKHVFMIVLRLKGRGTGRCRRTHRCWCAHGCLRHRIERRHGVLPGHGGRQTPSQTHGDGPQKQHTGKIELPHQEINTGVIRIDREQQQQQHSLMMRQGQCVLQSEQ